MVPRPIPPILAPIKMQARKSINSTQNIAITFEQQSDEYHCDS
jgi:hypothetical protein